MSNLTLLGIGGGGGGGEPPAWTPADLTPDLWFDAGEENYSQGAAVTSWTDLSGNADHAVHGGYAGTSPPSFQTSIVNGLPVVRFIGASLQYLQSALTIGGTSATIAIVAVRRTGANGRWAAIVNSALASDYGSASACAWQFAGTSGADTLVERDWGSQGTIASAAVDAPFILIARWNGTNHLFRLNGVDNTPGAYSGTFNGTHIMLGCGWDSTHPHYYGTVDLAEVVFLKRALTTGAESETASLETYFADKYAITI